MSDASSRVLLLVGDFVEDYEAMVPYQILLTVGITVDVVCPGKKPGEKCKTAVHDFEGDQTYSEKPGHMFTVTYDLESVQPSDYDGLVIPGGRAPEYLRLNPRVVDVVGEFCRLNKPIASICHGAQLLTATGMLYGRIVTAYPACGPEVTLAGATMREVAADQVVEDGNIVSGPAWPSHPAVMAAFLRKLGYKIEKL